MAITPAADRVAEPDQDYANDRELDHVDAVNQIFAEFEFAYHNQFHKAFKDEVSLNLAKQLWLKKLEIFSLDLIFEAIDELTSKSKFLPSLSQTLEEIKSHYLKKEGIQSIESAFAEACLGSDEPENFKWSHPLVYETAKNFGWADLRRSEEREGFEKFQSLMSDSIKDYLCDASNFYLPELNAIKETFKNTIPKISSTKSLTGHPLGAASVHEAIYSLIMMENNFIAASANIKDMDDGAKPFPIVTKVEKNVSLNAVMSNSFGFGGTNSTLVFEKLN